MGGSKELPIQNGAAPVPSGLSRSISMCNITKTNKIRQACQADLQPGESPFFLRYFMTMTRYMVILPPLLVMVKMIREKLHKILFDDYIGSTLQRAKIINWCPTTKPLYPKWTRGDGNCLLHAVSLYLWGIHDDPLFLRGLVHQALLEDVRQDLRQRWKREKLYWNSTIPEGGLELDADEWDREWSLVVDLARDERQDDSPNTLPYRSLEEIHIFVLANTIRRPIIILAEHVIRNIQGSSLAPNHVGGVYLPTLCHSDDCVKTPVVLCYESNHFVPLLSMEDAPCSSPLAERAVHAVPLVTENLEILPVHFLSASEESQVSELFKKYLDLVELPWTKSDSVSEVLAARIHLNRLPDDMNLTDDYYIHIEKICREESRSSEREKDLAGLDNRKKAPTIDLQMEKEPLARNISVPSASPEVQDQVLDFYVKNMDDVLGVGSERGRSITRSVSEIKDPQPWTETVPLYVEAQQWRSQQSRKCITKDCDYFGLPESGGRCSACVIEFTKHSKASNKATSNDRRNKGAPVKRTASFQGINRSLSDDVTAGFADISPIEDRKCAYPSCHLYSSRTTSPYCLKHKDKGTIVSRLNQEKERDVSSYYAIQTLETPEGRCESNSLESIVTQFPKMCIVPGCQNSGDHKSGSMCTTHYVTLGSRKEPNSFHFDFRGDQGEEHDLKMCKNKRCSRYGEAALRGYCDDCYRNLDITQNLQNEQKLLRMKGAGRRTPERPKSWAVPKTSYREHLFENQDQVMMPATKKPVDKDVNLMDMQINQQGMKRHLEETLKVNNYGPTPRSKSPKRTSQKKPAELLDWREPAEAIPEMNDPVPEVIQKCTKPGCSGIQALNNSGLCWPCVKETLKPSTTKASPSPAQFPPPTSSSYSKPSTSTHLMESCSTPALARGGNIESSVRTTSYMETTSAGEYSRRPRKCATQSCERQGLDANNGFCSRCYDVQMSSQQPPEGEESPPSSGERLSYTQEMKHQQKCINPSCESHGLEINKGLCQECFNFLATKDTSKSSRVTLELLPKRDMYEYSKCVGTGCDMYGTSEKEGLCSQCYIKYRSRRSDQMATSGSRSARSPSAVGYLDTSGSSITALPCCNHHCTRYGDPVFHGYCSECYINTGYNYDARPEDITNSFSLGHTSSDYLANTQRHYYHDPLNLDIKICRNRRYTGCNNFSHLKCKGFCRGCYVAIRSNIH